MRAVLIVILLMALGLIWQRLNKSLYDDAFSPFSLLLYFWMIPFVLSFANLSGLQTGITAFAVMVISVSTLLLVLTCLLPAWLISKNRRRTMLVSSAAPARMHAGWVLGFYVVTVLALYVAEFRGNDLPLLTYILGDASDSNLHTQGKDSKLQFIAAGTQIAAIFVFYLLLHAEGRWRRAFYMALSLSIVVLGLIKASKSDIYMPLLSFAALHYYHRRENKTPLPLRYKAVAALSLLVIISITSIRLEGIGLVGGYAGLIDFKYSDQFGPALSEIISIAYGYTAIGFQNFSNYVESHAAEFRVGASLFRPVLSVLMLGDVANSIGVPVDQWNVVSDAANTGTFLTPLYIEGGILFCAIGSCLYGLLVNTVYHKFRSAGRLEWRLLYVAIIFPWTWLFFTNGFSVLSVYINLFYVLALTYLCTRSKPHRATLAPLVQ